MSTYEELQIIISIALLIVTILNYSKHKKESRSSEILRLRRVA